MRHIRDAHKNTGKVFQCDVCLKPAKSLGALQAHKQTYHRPDQF